MTDTPANPVGPRRDRPEMPDGYGLPISTDGLLGWSEVEEKLISAQHYWLATTRPDGRPHVVPRWGVWLSGRFYYDGAPTTRHVINLASNPACALHLESGAQAVIVEGVSEPTRAHPDGLGTLLAAAFGKYHDAGYQPGPGSWAAEDGGGLRMLTPQRAIAWFTFPTDATRFRFS